MVCNVYISHKCVQCACTWPQTNIDNGQAVCIFLFLVDPAGVVVSLTYSSHQVHVSLDSLEHVL